jgi:hypothetical protein
MQPLVAWCRFTPSGGLRKSSFLHYICYVIKPWFILSLALAACSNPQPETHIPLVDSSQTVLDTFVLSDTAQLIHPDSLMHPYHYDVIALVMGDVNADRNPEKVVIYNTGIETDFGQKRVLKIYSKTKQGWAEIASSDQCILPSKHGGALGDPFVGIEIVKGIISLRHHGGSRTKWDYLHKYQWRKQEWKLIGVTIENRDPCISKEVFDLNLLTGKAVNTLYKEKCYKNGDFKEAIEQSADKFNVLGSDTLNLGNTLPGNQTVKHNKQDKFFVY